MSRGVKLAKFAELHTLPGVFEQPLRLNDSWHKLFGNTQPIVLELGCGYGEYTIALAQRYPQRNYIGVDIKGERLWHAAKTAIALNLPNVRWLRIPIDQLINYFAPSEVAEIWLTFPDPFPRTSQAKKRLTHPRFLQLYQIILQPLGRLHLKTDAADLIDYTGTSVPASGGIIDRTIEAVAVDAVDAANFDLDIITRFEQKYRSQHHAIFYLSWYWPPTIAPSQPTV